MESKASIQDLLERFMEESEETRRWVTVSELRLYWGREDRSSLAIAGFLRRLAQGPFSACPYRVEGIEKIELSKPRVRFINRYLVSRRPPARAKPPGASLRGGECGREDGR